MARLTKLILSALTLLAGCTSIKPLVIASHMSDPSRGSRHETTADFIGAGVTAEHGGVSIDAAIGRKAIDCDAFDRCPSTLGALATFRWSPK
jgi:hypothetical protein